jgi:hypothetical protein
MGIVIGLRVYYTYRDPRLSFVVINVLVPSTLTVHSTNNGYNIRSKFCYFSENCIPIISAVLQKLPGTHIHTQVYLRFRGRKCLFWLKKKVLWHLAGKFFKNTPYIIHYKLTSPDANANDLRLITVTV